MEKGELLSTGGGNVNWCSHCGKPHRGFQQLKREPPYDSSIVLLGIQADLVSLHVSLLRIFHKLKVCDTPASNKSISTIFQQRLLTLLVCVTFW